MIKIEGVTKRYGDLVALNNLSLTIDNEVFGLLGANGAGKSTLLKLMLGVIEPDEGKILINDREVKLHPTETRRIIGYLPENLVLYERLTGHEFLQFIAGLKEVGKTANQIIDEELAHFQLQQKRDLLIRQYSFGMKKRIGLIAALLGDPQLLILDEPLNGLDVETIALMRQRIETLKRAGKTIIFSSHIMDFVERVAARAVILRRGTIAALGTIAQLRQEAHMPGGHFEDVFFYFSKISTIEEGR